MQVYFLPSKIYALIFDLDLTLYTNQEYVQYQTDSLVEKIGELRGICFTEMSAKVEEARKAWSLSHGGKKSSLSNALITYGISMEENIRLRNEIYEPARFLKEDKRLRETLKELSQFFILGLVTNNPVLVASKTLDVLGVTDFFPIIIGLDTCMCAKPHQMPFMKFSELSSCAPETCVSIGDRYDIDLDIPLKLGMGGILVDGVEDVYRLCEVLN